ncbi:5032_t:CDS:2, partial [Ambispora gerdemannii]
KNMFEHRYLTDEEIEDSNNEESGNELDSIQLRSDEFRAETRIIHKKCLNCGNFRTNFAWCQSCETTWFKEKYSSWTTSNLQLDLIIQKSQAEASISGDYLEYIPYDQFELVEFHKDGAFSEIYSAIWLEGPKWDWNENTQAWSRGGPIKVALKKLKNSLNLSKQFLEKLRKYHHCLQSGSVADTFGISKDPENIHRSNLYHGNLHGGNIMIEDESISTDGRIADIGIHGSVDTPYNNELPTAIELNETFSDWITDICDNPISTGISEEFNIAEERSCENFQIQKNASQETHKDAFYTSRFFNFPELRGKFEKLD